jgi:hypothetical protein
MASYSQIKLPSHIFPLNFKILVCFSLPSSLIDLSLSLNYLIYFLPRQGCVGSNPNSWSSLEALPMGTLSHLLINS